MRSLDSSGSMPRRGLGTLNELHGGPQARRLGSCPATALPPPPGQPETVVGLRAVLITPCRPQVVRFTASDATGNTDDCDLTINAY